MTKFIVDGEEYSAKPDENLLQACLGAGLDLPYFCWHPALGSVGACRQCAVRQYANEEDKTGKLVMACMTPVAEGARFSVADPEAAALRASVIEWLMINHPHDCPVCEEGGECHLQDMTMMTGHTTRRYRFTKRTHRNQDLGPFIKHEMNRCIGCYRCTRFYRDYAGGRDLDVFAAHDHVYFGRHADGTLESEFSGNLVEVCPTGVFTDKTFSAHYARKWDMRGAPSVCTHCGLGCNTTVNERAGKLRRILNRYNGAVNGYFLCDRGRFGYGFVNAPERIRTPRARGADGAQLAVSRAEAIARFAALLGAGGRVVGIGSPRASLEANFALRALVGHENFYPGVSTREGALLRLISDILGAGAAHAPSIRDVERADAALLLGSDLPNAAPRAALALRQAVREAGFAPSAKVEIAPWHDAAVRTYAGDVRNPLFIATPAPTRLDDIALDTLRAAPADIARLGFAVAACIDPAAPAVAGLSADLAARASEIAQALLAAKRPLVVSGVEAGEESVIQAAANIAGALRARGKSGALLLNVPECNSLGLALMTQDRPGFEAALAEPPALVIVLENDLFRRAESMALDAALAATRLVVLDHSEGPVSHRAALVLPAASFAECGGTLVSTEGRAQRFYPPILAQGDVREAWRWLGEAGRAAGRDGCGWDTEDGIVGALASALPCFAAVPRAAPLETFRIAGNRISSEPHRFSGRTAMHAAQNVREPKPPVSADSPFSATMEGYYGKMPPALLPFTWAPGWNSAQAINKFQAEIGGALKGGDPGVRLLEAQAEVALGYYTNIPGPFAPRPGMWRAVMLPRVFGDEEQSARAAPVRERMAPPALVLNEEDAASIGAASGEMLACELGGEIQHLALEIQPGLPRGVAGVAGLAASAHALPGWVRITTAGAGAS
ncbi:NADH-quinone oxidoreductase subunit NuoG, partial [Acidocella sp.]|uniref:NADH-quinone oxidoreductase subunit NuoG n=1 Tax=Acidocella sp. TaxID=50710 RepID=UPI0017C2E7E6